MSRHPITPMNEADLRVHLAQQTKKRIDLLDILQVDQSPAEAFDELVRRGAEVVLIDLLYERHLVSVGSLLQSGASRQSPNFVVGSSGVTSALCAHWQISDPPKLRTAAAGGPIVAVSGSCSPVTANQVDWAAKNGFAELQLSESADGIVSDASKAIADGKSVVVHSGLGRKMVTNQPIGASLGAILLNLLASTRVRRVLVAGGDTSGDVAGALGIESLEMIAMLTRGSPLCRATAPRSPADGIEITFKGGQIGPVDFFGMVERGIAHV